MGLANCFANINVHTNYQGILLQILAPYICNEIWDSAFLISFEVKSVLFIGDDALSSKVQRNYTF